MNDKWKIWFENFDEDGTPTGCGVLPNEYVHKGNAVRKARNRFGNKPCVRWYVSKNNPFVK